MDVLIGPGAGRSTRSLILGLVALVAAGSWSPALAGLQVRPVRAAHFHHYMPAEHVDRLAIHGFTRAVVHFTVDSLRDREIAELRALDERARELGMELVPQFRVDAPTRLSKRPEDRRYTWGRGQVEPVACPLDSAWWADALIDRAGEFLGAAPGTLRLAMDLELQHGGRQQYDAGPCRCVHCLREYRPDARPEQLDHTSQSGLRSFQERRLARIFAGILTEFAERHPGVELGVHDLDHDSDVHRALARALAGTRIPVADYCTRSYGTGGAPLVGARDRLRRLGLEPVSLIGGLWLKRLKPGSLGTAVASVLDRADGYFVFSTYSLWREPHQLVGPYTLLAPREEYWNALRRANGPPSFGKPPIAARAPLP